MGVQLEHELHMEPSSQLLIELFMTIKFRLISSTCCYYLDKELEHAQGP